MAHGQRQSPSVRPSVRKSESPKVRKSASPKVRQSATPPAIAPKCCRPTLLPLPTLPLSTGCHGWFLTPPLKPCISRPASKDITREWRNGRRASLRCWWVTLWGFESPLAHDFSSVTHGGALARRRLTPLSSSLSGSRVMAGAAARTHRLANFA